jgi:hypothetical protein
MGDAVVGFSIVTFLLSAAGVKVLLMKRPVGTVTSQ